MKTSLLVILALVGDGGWSTAGGAWATAQDLSFLQEAAVTPAQILEQQTLQIEKGLEWIGDLKLGDVESVIKIRGFLNDLTQLMSIVTYANEEFAAAHVDFGRILNQYIEIAQASQNIARLVGNSIVDAADYAESIEELTHKNDREERIDTWGVVVRNIQTNAKNVQDKVAKIHAEALSSNENILKAMKNLQVMFGKTQQGLEIGAEEVQNNAILAERELTACEEKKAADKKSRFQDKNPLNLISDGFKTIVDSSIDPCIAKERNVRRTLAKIEAFEQGKVQFDTVIGPDFKATARAFLGSMSEFPEPAILSQKFADISVTASVEESLTADYKTITTETKNVKVLADSTLAIAAKRMKIAKEGMLTQFQNMVLLI